MIFLFQCIIGTISPFDFETKEFQPVKRLVIINLGAW